MRYDARELTSLDPDYRRKLLEAIEDGWEVADSDYEWRSITKKPVRKVVLKRPVDSAQEQK